MNSLRIGNGFDVHQFQENRKLIIGGVKIPYKFGLMGHSDADVLIHAIIDSLCGAADLGDIGRLFPDTEKEFKDISSVTLLKKVSGLLQEKGVDIINIDTIIVCEEPKISPHAEKMKEIISSTLNITPGQIGIKGTTTEHLGFTGRGEGIAVYSVALVMLQS